MKVRGDSRHLHRLRFPFAPLRLWIAIFIHPSYVFFLSLTSAPFFLFGFLAMNIDLRGYSLRIILSCGALGVRFLCGPSMELIFRACLAHCRFPLFSSSASFLIYFICNFLPLRTEGCYLHRVISSSSPLHRNKRSLHAFLRDFCFASIAYYRLYLAFSFKGGWLSRHLANCPIST